MKVELMFCEETILQEIADKNFTRYDVALTYAFCREAKESQNVNFRTINEAIVKRWSLFALGYIKEKAAKLLDEKYRDMAKEAMINPWIILTEEEQQWVNDMRAKGYSEIEIRDKVLDKRSANEQ